MKGNTELQAIYRNRFGPRLEYRRRVWATLCAKFWSQFIPEDSSVLDLGCGYGEFINQIRCHRKWAIDFNPTTRQYLDSSITFLEQDCSMPWSLPDESLDVVFTSNFFEHLPDKGTLRRTLAQTHRCLRKSGLLIAMGPNIRYLPGSYWDFWDHQLPITDKSLREALQITGFKVEKQFARFLPYSMAEGPTYPIWLVSIYLSLFWLWPFFGKQFLVVARKSQ